MNDFQKGDLVKFRRSLPVKLGVVLEATWTGAWVTVLWMDGRKISENSRDLDKM